MAANIKIYYLSIASFNIQILCYATERTNIQRRFLQEIMPIIKNCQIKKDDIPPRVIDCRIEVLGRNMLLLQKMKNKLNFVNFLEKKTRSWYQTYYHIGRTQFEMILRVVLEALLPKKRGLLIHGSSCIHDNKVVVFCGPSGYGKTTKIKLLRRTFQPFTDDSMFLVFDNVSSKYLAYQTPLTEKTYSIKKNNLGYEIRSLFFLKKGVKDQLVVRIENRKKIFANLLRVIFYHQDTQKRSLASALFFLKKNPACYSLAWSRNESTLIKEIYAV